MTDTQAAAIAAEKQVEKIGKVLPGARLLPQISAVKKTMDLTMPVQAKERRAMLAASEIFSGQAGSVP